jgi:glycosyltransferase involved in cell wall biosynthesis
LTRAPLTIVAHDVGGIGGMERQLAELITGAADVGRAVTVIARTCRVDEHPRINFVRVRGPARPFVLAFPWFFVLGGWKVARRAAGLVHTTGAIVPNSADLSTIHLCHQALAEHTDLVRSSRSTWRHRLNARVAAALSRRAEGYCLSARNTGLLVTVSQGVRREIERYFPARQGEVQVIPNGVDSELFSPDATRRERMRANLGLGERLVAIFVGSEWEGKGLRYAIDALRSNSGWTLLVVGRGDQQRYRQVAADLGVAERLIFHPPTADLAGLYNAADAFILPSAYETFSLVTYEAAASGLPLIVSRVSGIEEILEPDSNGWFVEPGGEQISDCLRRLESADVRAEMGRRARDSVLGYTWGSVVEGYERLYERLASG